MCIRKCVHLVHSLRETKKGIFVYMLTQNSKEYFHSLDYRNHNHNHNHNHYALFIQSHPITAKMNLFSSAFSSWKAMVVAFSVAFLVITGSSNSAQAQVSSVLLPFSKDVYIRTRMPKNEFQSICARCPKKIPRSASNSKPYTRTVAAVVYLLRYSCL